MSKILESIIRRLPREMELHSRVRVYTNSWLQNVIFWAVFTSREFMPYLPHLMKIKKDNINVIDCGAFGGYFCLFIEHYKRLSMLEWDNIKYVMIEPSDSCFRLMEKNAKMNLGDYELLKGLVGRKAGAAFFENTAIQSRASIKGKGIGKPFVDITGFLKKPNILKVNIEGEEFEFFEEYKNDLNNVEALIVEWHCYDKDWTKYEKAKKIIEANSLEYIRRGTERHQNMVQGELYMRKG